MFVDLDLFIRVLGLGFRSVLLGSGPWYGHFLFSFSYSGFLFSFSYSGFFFSWWFVRINAACFGVVDFGKEAS